MRRLANTSDFEIRIESAPKSLSSLIFNFFTPDP